MKDSNRYSAVEAAALIAYRTKHGPCKALEDLIGELNKTVKSDADQIEQSRLPHLTRASQHRRSYNGGG